MEYPIDLPGGGQESTKTLCEGLASTGDFEPVVACPQLLTTTEGDYRYRIVTYKSDENRELSKVRRISNFLSRIASFHRIIVKEQPDLIHVSMSESLISFGALRVLGAYRKIPFIYTDRSLYYGYRKHSRSCIKATMKHAARMLTTTKFNASLWEKEVSVPITVIYNTISTAFSEYDPDKRSAMRDKYGVAEQETVIGFAGRISEEKDWGKVPGVVKAIAASGIKIKVALVLSLYEEKDKQISETIKDGIISFVGSDNLIYMHDLDQKQMSDYYYLVDFFIMTSNFESFGKAAVEAMSRKCVVLSTAVGGLPEVIDDRDDLYDMDDLTKLTDRIRQLASSPSAMEDKRQRCYRRFADNFTTDKNIEGHIKVYREILK